MYYPYFKTTQNFVHSIIRIAYLFQYLLKNTIHQFAQIYPLLNIQMQKNRSSVSYSVNAKVNFRIMIVGDSGVGKTSMIIRFVKGSFSRFANPASVGIEFYSKNIDIQDQQISLQLWDTAGQQNFKSLAKSFYNQASCVIIAYSNPKICQKTLQFYALEINEHAVDGVKVVVARTQIDETQITQQQKAYLDVLVKEKKIESWMGISSKSGLNIDNFFKNLTEKLYTHYLNDEHFREIVDPKKNSIILDKSPVAEGLKENDKNKKKRNCC